MHALYRLRHITSIERLLYGARGGDRPLIASQMNLQPTAVSTGKLNVPHSPHTTVKDADAAVAHS